MFYLKINYIYVKHENKLYFFWFFKSFFETYHVNIFVSFFFGRHASLHLKILFKSSCCFRRESNLCFFEPQNMMIAVVLSAGFCRRRVSKLAVKISL